MEEQMQEGQGSVHPALPSGEVPTAAPLSGVQESQGSATPARLSFTPGPWIFAREYGEAITELPRITTVARCCDFVIGLPSAYPGGNYRDGDPSGDPEADARLIAAAPDMLKALRRAVLALAFAAESSPAMRDDYNAVSAAIARATGASND